MKPYSRIVTCLFALVVIAGCTSPEVSNRKILVDEKVPRPDRIWVYDFAATSADVPADSTLAGKTGEHATPQTAEQIAAGRLAGAQVAEQLVEEINGMGLLAVRASSESKPRIYDLVVLGYILSVDEGSATKRVAIGFGSGASELAVAVEGFQMTAQGLRKIGSGNVGSGSNKTPGAALGVVGLIATANPAGLVVGTGVKAYGEYSGSSKIEGKAKEAAKEIAKELRPKFEKQGWIK